MLAGAGSAKEFEQSVCNRIKTYIGIQTKLASTVLLGTTAENFVKSMTKCYKALLALVRLVRSSSACIPIATRLSIPVSIRN